VRVLLVEDEDRIASFIQKGLATRGFAVRRVANGGEVAEAVDGSEVVVLDLGLPDVDGLEVLTRLRQDGVSTPVVILTARGEVEDRVSGLELGADDYLPKPFSIEELAARLRARLRERAPETTTLHVSTISDSWIQISYSLLDGERNRALSIIKSRGSKHSNQLRELTFSDTGITLTDPYTAGGEVLMGTLRMEKENAVHMEANRRRNEFDESRWKVRQGVADGEQHLEPAQRDLQRRTKELDTLAPDSDSQVKNERDK